MDRSVRRMMATLVAWTVDTRHSLRLVRRTGRGEQHVPRQFELAVVLRQLFVRLDQRTSLGEVWKGCWSWIGPKRGAGVGQRQVGAQLLFGDFDAFEQRAHRAGSPELRLPVTLHRASGHP